MTKFAFIHIFTLFDELDKQEIAGSMMTDITHSINFIKLVCYDPDHRPSRQYMPRLKLKGKLHKTFNVKC